MGLTLTIVEIPLCFDFIKTNKKTNEKQQRSSKWEHFYFHLYTTLNINVLVEIQFSNVHNWNFGQMLNICMCFSTLFGIVIVAHIWFHSSRIRIEWGERPTMEATCFRNSSVIHTRWCCCWSCFYLAIFFFWQLAFSVCALLWTLCLHGMGLDYNRCAYSHE